MVFRDLVDAHVHADGLTEADLVTLAHFGVAQVIVCSHDGALERRGREASVRGWLSHFEALLTREAARLKRAGIRPLFALGVHPSHAPAQGLEALLQELPGFLSDPSVVAIGGLSFAGEDPRARLVLQRQLELAAELRRPVFVAAPVWQPARGMRQLALLLRDTDLPPERVLVERAPLESLPLVRACGFSLALEPSDGRLSLRELAGFIRQHGPERLVLTSHAGEGAANLLAVPSVAARLLDEGLSEVVVRRVARDNALRLVGRSDSVRHARVG